MTPAPVPPDAESRDCVAVLAALAAGRAAADEPWREAIAFINWFAEGPCGCDGDPQDPCDSCRALALLTRLDDLAGRAAASPDPPDTFGTGSLYDRERPAASPDSPDDRESLIAAEFFAAGMRAASPDERLREAGPLPPDVIRLCVETHHPIDTGSLQGVRLAVVYPMRGRADPCRDNHSDHNAAMMEA